MIIQNSVLTDLLASLPDLHPQIYFKSSLTALSHAMEDQVLAGDDSPLVMACFQKERFYRQEASRYQKIAHRTEQLYILASPETNFCDASGGYETIAFDPTDGLANEWHLVIIGKKYASCLICRENLPQEENSEKWLNYPGMDTVRRFTGIWSFDRQIVCLAANILLERILVYRPELVLKIALAKNEFLGDNVETFLSSVDANPFVQRLVTYIQASEYKLLKTYRTIAAQERKERLVNSMAYAIRQSLNPEEILAIAVQELGQTIASCRCLIYRCQATDHDTIINHQFLKPNITSVLGKRWLLSNNNLFKEVLKNKQPVYVIDTRTDERTKSKNNAQKLAKEYCITSWLMIPILYQDRLLGLVELHHCEANPHQWQQEQIELVEAIAPQIGSALIQAESYANLEDLKEQLEALDRTRSNLVAITGHELRTPLSTIQVCLESLATEPDMPQELRQIMLSSALEDAERMRKLIQDFLTLSRLESGRVKWHFEAISLQECIDLALSSIMARYDPTETPTINIEIPENVPLVQADGEWLVEVLSKLLDNACKFTNSEGEITINTKFPDEHYIEVLVIDTGRGIESKLLETVFDRFYQEEGALRRSTGGTGLGLAICRQIVKGWGGKIWAESGGKDQGSEFHFTLPLVG
jgi:DICT domain-containing protein/signal transduction histidine kinase